MSFVGGVFLIDEVLVRADYIRRLQVAWPSGLSSPLEGAMNPSPFEYLIAFFDELEHILPSSNPGHAVTWETIERFAPLSAINFCVVHNQRRRRPMS
jgi:hypothetical protein